jgi:hypothetical protein
MTGRRVIDRIAAMTDWPATPDARYSLLGHTHAGEDITSGTVADARIAESLSGKTLVTPVIASFVNAQHNHADAAGGGTVSGAGGDAATLDGLDSTAFAILAGQAGGQTLIGGTASGNNLTLRSTSHATKGKIFFGLAGTTVYDEANERIGLGTATPAAVFDGLSTSASTILFRLKAAASQSADLVDIRNSANVQQVRVASDGSLILTGQAISAGWLAPNGNSFGQFGAQIGNGFDLYWGDATTRINGSAATDYIQLITNGIVRLNVRSDGMIAVGSHTPTAVGDFDASTTARASLRVRAGVAPTSPNDGDIWHDNTNIYIRIGGVTRTFNLT